MSTQINVSVALEELRRLNQAQINANRQAQLLQALQQTQAQKAVNAQAQSQAAQGLNLNGQLLYGTRSDRQRPQPEPFAAYRSGAGAFDDYLATAYALREIATGATSVDIFTATTKVRAMEGGSPVEMTQTGYPIGGQTFSYADPAYTIYTITKHVFYTEVFPIEKETALVVSAIKSSKAISRYTSPFGPSPLPSPGFTLDSFEEIPLDVQAVVFNRNNARLVTVPSAFELICDAHMGAATYTPGVQNGSYAIISYPTISYSGYLAPALNFRGYGLETGSAPSIPATPVSGLQGSPCLQAFLTQSPPLGSVTTYAQLLTFLAGEGLTTPTKTYASCMVNGTCPTGVFNYDVIGRVANDADSYLGDETFTQARLKDYAVPSLIPENPSITEKSRFMLTAWDWNQPTYCRTKLLELGFTTADLTP